MLNKLGRIYDSSLKKTHLVRDVFLGAVVILLINLVFSLVIHFNKSSFGYYEDKEEPIYHFNVLCLSGSTIEVYSKTISNLTDCNIRKISVVNVKYKSILKVGNFIDALYVSIVTFTTLGYGDITPNSSGMKLIMAIEGFIGVSFIAGLFLWIGTKYEDRKHKNQEQVKNRLELKIKKEQLNTLKNKVFKNYALVKNCFGSNLVEILSGTHSHIDTLKDPNVWDVGFFDREQGRKRFLILCVQLGRGHGYFMKSMEEIKRSDRLDWSITYRNIKNLIDSLNILLNMDPELGRRLTENMYAMNEIFRSWEIIQAHVQPFGSLDQYKDVLLHLAMNISQGYPLVKKGDNLIDCNDNLLMEIEYFCKGALR